MLKKCVLVPNKQMKIDNLANSSFKRGAMGFEDFNYSLYNPYILIEKDSSFDDDDKANDTVLTNKELC